MSDPLPPTKWLPAGWKDLPHTFKRSCALLGVIKKISLLSEASQQAYESGTLENLQDAIMQEAYCEIDLDPRPDLPPELLANPITVKLAVYDLGWFRTNLVEENKPLIQGFWNIPWMAFSDGALNTDFKGDDVILLYDPTNPEEVPLVERIILLGLSDCFGDNVIDRNGGVYEGLHQVLPREVGLDGYLEMYASTFNNVNMQDLVVYKNGYIHRFQIALAEVPNWPGTVDGYDQGNIHTPEVYQPTRYSKRNFFTATTEVVQADAAPHTYSVTQLIGLAVGITYFKQGPNRWHNTDPDPPSWGSGDDTYYSPSKKIIRRSSYIGSPDINEVAFYPRDAPRVSDVGSFNMDTYIFTSMHGFPISDGGFDDGKTLRARIYPVYNGITGEVEDFTIIETYDWFNYYEYTETASLNSTHDSSCSGTTLTQVDRLEKNHECVMLGVGVMATTDEITLTCTVNNSSYFVYDKLTTTTSGYADPDCEGSLVSRSTNEQMHLISNIEVGQVYTLEYSDGFSLELGTTIHSLDISRDYDSNKTLDDPILRPIPKESAVYSGTLIYFLGIRLGDGICFFVEVNIDEITQEHQDIYELESIGPGDFEFTTAKLTLKAVINRKIIIIDEVQVNTDGEEKFYLEDIWQDPFWEYDDWTTIPKPKPHEAAGQNYFSEPQYTKFIPNLMTDWPFEDGTFTRTWYGAVPPPHHTDFIPKKLVEYFKYFEKTVTDYVYTYDNEVVQQQYHVLDGVIHPIPVIGRHFQNSINYTKYYPYWDMDNKMLTYWTPNIHDPASGYQLFFIDNELALKVGDHDMFTFEYHKVA